MRVSASSRLHKTRFCVLTILLAFTSVNSTARLLVPDQQTKLWNEVIKLYNQGYDILERQYRNWDDEALWQQRKAVFTEAADKLDSYINTYVKDSNSLTYLRAKFRLGTYREIAQNFRAARDAYLTCSKHPLIKDSGAVFDGKALEPQVKERLAEVESNMRKQYSRRPGYIYIHRGGGHAIFEERDFESLPNIVKDMCP